jgi:hypothetical protein
MNLKRRLGKLERHLIAASGLVPHSRAWMEHWTREWEKVLAENDYVPPKVFHSKWCARSCNPAHPSRCR